MPKIKVARRPPTDDYLPIWDALVAESRDPRPHEPLFIEPAYAVPDDHFAAETIAFDEAFSWVDSEVDDTMRVLGDIGREANTALDAVYPWPEPSVLLVVDASSALASLDVESTQVLPVWPTTTDETRDEES